MPDKYKDVLSGYPVLLAMLAAAGGCLVNYLTIYKQTGRLNLSFLFIDLIVSCFIGFFVFGVLTDWGLTANEAAAGTAVAGNLGAKVFSLAQFLIGKQTGCTSLFKEQHYEADEGPDKGV